MIYKVIERKDPRFPNEPGKWYGAIVSLDSLDIEQLAERISASSTVTRHDCLAVLSALQEQIIYALQEGKRVHLGDIGSFRVTANGKGADTPEAYDPDTLMQAIRVRFTPNVKLKEALELDGRKFSLQRVEFAPGEGEEEEEEEGGEEAGA